MARSSVKRSIDFNEVLPLLVSTYQRGRLVPFLGAGMSFPMLHLWQGFVENLEDQAQKISGEAERAAEIPCEIAKADQLTGRAQRATTVLRNACNRAQFFEAIQSALFCGKSGVPELTDALAAIAWPLVISTNYDDLYYGACRCSPALGELGAEVLGRSPMDCKRLISSLNGAFDRQYIWHVQGFLGGQHPNHPRITPRARADALQDELVVGHAEYRCVANTAAQFRRSFGEVFRTRSFLFLGSSLTEDYFLNMFSEVLELLGPSTIPHFAFTKQDTVDVEFLAAEMNITVCEVCDWPELPGLLKQLKCAIEGYLVRTVRWSSAPTSSVQPAQSLRLDLKVVPHGLPEPDSLEAQDAVAIGTGRCDDQPQYGGLWSYEDTLKEQYPDARFPDDRHVLRFEGTRFYAVAARDPKKEKGSDDVHGVYVAMQELFDEIRDYECLHLALPHAPQEGRLSEVYAFPPVYAFIETVQAFAAWKRKTLSSQVRLVIYTMQPDVWLNLNSHRIDIGELLKSELMPVWAVVQNDERREPARRVLYYKRDTLFSKVLDDLRIFRPNSWRVSICPNPRREDDGGTVSERVASDLSPCHLDQIGVVFGSVLTFRKPVETRSESSQ